MLICLITVHACPTLVTTPTVCIPCASTRLLCQVATAVLHAQFPAAKDLKAAFVLTPAEGSGLPCLLQSRLNAPRILQVSKVRRSKG